MNAQDDSEDGRADNAMVRRLARLRERPVDTAGLRRGVREGIAARRRAGSIRRWITPLRALAASLLLAGIVAAVLVASCRSTVLASPEELSLIHRENVSGEDHATAVGSMMSAQQVLTAQWKECPRLPDTSLAAVISCHVHQHGDKRLACLQMTVDGPTVTLAVARAGDMHVPQAPSVRRDGVGYGTQSSGAVNIVVTQREDLWLCLMGELPVERLVEVAASFQV